LNASLQSHFFSPTLPTSSTALSGSRKASSLDDVFNVIRDYRSIAKPQLNPVPAIYAPPLPAGDLDGQLRSSRTAFKIAVSQVSMHLGLTWLQKLFGQIDSLLDVEEWDTRDPVPTSATARTFIRMLLVLRIDRKPGLGVSNSGNLIAAWTAGANRLTVECCANDRVRWVLSRDIDGDIERAAGEGKIERLQEILKPYKPEIWFEYAEQLSAG